MQVKRVAIPYTRSNSVFRIYNFGDLHSGTIHCVEDNLRREVKKVAGEKYSYWVGMGDQGEFIVPDDPRFDPSAKSIPDWVKPDDIGACIENRIVDIYKPIAKKCLGMMFGNHEDAFRKHHKGNVHQHICDRLEVDNLGYSCFLLLHFKRNGSSEAHVIKGCYTHGSGNCITAGAKRNKLRRFMQDNDADFYAYAHMHDLFTDDLPYLDVQVGPDKITAREKVGTTTGCWFRTYTQGIVASYGECKAYPPTTIGCSYFEIDVEENTIKAVKEK